MPTCAEERELRFIAAFRKLDMRAFVAFLCILCTGIKLSIVVLFNVCVSLVDILCIKRFKTNLKPGNAKSSKETDEHY